MGIKEGALALADELEAFEDGDCEECSLYGQPECKGHLSCMEIMARYAARKMREAVERDGEGTTTVSAYDLLGDEDREAIAWVREHGGLDMTASRFESGEIAADMLWGKGHGRFWTTDEIEEEISKRIMPEGMEWPTVDGKPVDFKTAYGPSLGVLEAVSIYNTGACQVMSHDGIIKSAKDIHIVKPKVLDADGAEIREGDVLYSVEPGDYVIVDSIEPGNPWFATTDRELQHCAKFTHRAPVLAADGEPLEVGQTVWHVGNGVEFTVIGLPNPGEYQAVKLRLDDGAFTGLDPNLLTHQRPVLDADGVLCREGDEVWEVRSHRRREIVGTNYCDHRTGEPLILCDGDDAVPIPATCVTHTKPEPPDSWERIEEDALLPAGDYRERHGMEKRDGMTWPQQIREDLVRRCRAMAEKENKNE